jgi:hypothetical protein
MQVKLLGMGGCALLGMGACGEWALRPLGDNGPGDTSAPVRDISVPPFEEQDYPSEEDPDTASEPADPLEPGQRIEFPPTEDTGEDPSGDPPVPPDEVLSNCASPAASAEWSNGEIWVATNGSTAQSGDLHVTGSGWFHIYSAYSAESGASQQNESAFYRIENEVSVEGAPQFGNCGTDWIVQDGDNDAPWTEGAYIYIGTFELVEGVNTLNLFHYCLLFWEGECSEFHFEEELSSTCDSSNPNSAHFSGDLCLLGAEGPA